MVGDLGFLWPPPCLALALFALVADTGTVIVDAEVTATELDVLVLEVTESNEDDAAEWCLLWGPEELLPDDEAAITYSVEVIVAALVVVGQLTGSAAEALRNVDAGLAATVVVESKPFTCSSNDSSVFVDLSAVVLADVLVVVHFITGRGLLVTLLVLLLLPLLLLLLL